MRSTTRAIKLREEGFTLIELMVSVAIIGILAATGVQSYDEYKIQARNAVAKMNLINITQGLEDTYTEDFDTYIQGDPNGSGGAVRQWRSQVANSPSTTMKLNGGGGCVNCDVDNYMRGVFVNERVGYEANRFNNGTSNAFTIHCDGNEAYIFGNGNRTELKDAASVAIFKSIGGC